MSIKIKGEPIWAVWFQDHIHTDANGQLACFATRDAARDWVSLYGIPGCRVAKVAIKL